MSMFLNINVESYRNINKKNPEIPTDIYSLRQYSHYGVDIEKNV